MTNEKQTENCELCEGSGTVTQGYSPKDPDDLWEEKCPECNETVEERMDDDSDEIDASAGAGEACSPEPLSEPDVVSERGAD